MTVFLMLERPTPPAEETNELLRDFTETPTESNRGKSSLAQDPMRRKNGAIQSSGQGHPDEIIDKHHTGTESGKWRTKGRTTPRDAAHKKNIMPDLQGKKHLEGKLL